MEQAGARLPDEFLEGGPVQAADTSPRLVLDLSTSLMRRGLPSTGIVRVERELAKALLRRRDVRAKFVAMNSSSRTFYALDEPTARAIVEDICNADVYWGYGPLTRHLRQAVKRLPDSLREQLRGLYFAARRLARTVLDLFPRASQTRPLPPQILAARVAADRALFQPDDVLLLAGLGCDSWNDELLRVKEATGIKIAHIVYDLIPHRMPEYCSPTMPPFFGRYIRNAILASDLMLVGSEATKVDLERFFRETATPKRPIGMFSYGCDIEQAGEPSPELQALQGRRIVLYVSTLEARKNHALLFSIWRRLHEERGADTPLLVFVGEAGWRTADLLAMIESSSLSPDYIRNFHGLHDHELAWLYEHCEFTVYPSFYEGWGLPISESLARGKVCIASNAASMPEACAGLGILLSPLDGLGWYEAIVNLLDDPTYRASLEASIKANYQPVTWAVSADGVVNQVLARFQPKQGTQAQGTQTQGTQAQGPQTQGSQMQGSQMPGPRPVIASV